MRNLILMISALMFSSAVFSQTDRSNELQLRFTTGLAAYKSMAELSYNDGNTRISETDTSGAVTQHFQLGARYDLTKRFTVGLDYKFGAYLYDTTETNRTRSNKFGVFGIAGEFNISSRPNFRWYVGLGFHASRLQISESETNGNMTTQIDVDFRGSGMSLNTGIIKYFGDRRLGFIFNAGYDGHSFEADPSFFGNIENLKYTLDVRGVDLQLGLLFRFY
ncbi:MAG: outer membrane beta-barrel protein [Flavobacteriales bacterium]